MVCVSPVVMMSRVGTIRATSPVEVFWPKPQPTCLIGDAEYAPEMVGVAVGVDDRDDRAVAPVVPVHRRGAFGRDQRIDDSGSVISGPRNYFYPRAVTA